MLEAAMTGGTPHEAAWNMGRFAYLRQHPDEARLFDAMMAHFPDNRHAAVAAVADRFGTEWQMPRKSSRRPNMRSMALLSLEVRPCFALLSFMVQTLARYLPRP